MNARVNYPIKKILNAMANDDIIDMTDEVTKFCVSWITLRVCDIGSRQVIDAWNNHPIPGKKNHNSSPFNNPYCIKDRLLMY